LVWRFNSTSKIGSLPGELCKGIILGQSFDGPPASTGPAVLVCAKVGDTTERISFGWVDQYNYERYDKGEVCDFEGSSLIRVNRLLEGPLELVKSWEEVQLG
jgi:hypothetical protein